MRTKILFLDIDNTLMFDDEDENSIRIAGQQKKISQKTLDLLSDLKKDYYIILATGRRFSNYESLLGVIPADYVILEHGSLIYGKGYDKEWNESLKKIIGTQQSRKGILWSYGKQLAKELKIASEGRYGSFRLDPKDNPGMTRLDLEKKLSQMPKELTYVKNESFLDIIPKSATKIMAMKYMAKKLNVVWKDTFFVGDDYNDADALCEIGHPYTQYGATADIITLVKKRKGYVSKERSFSAINDILLRIKEYHNQE